MSKNKKKGRQRANGEGAISDRKDGRKDVDSPSMALSAQTPQDHQEEPHRGAGLDRADEA